VKATAPIRFAGSQLAESRHVCAFFNNDDEEYRVLLPFIKEGFECGDKAVHVVNPDQRADHLLRLASGNAPGGFPLSRIVCHMEWAAENSPHIDRLMEFESRVNPMIIIGGILQQNPFFVPPEEFLPELRQRRARIAATL
jgi:hypothetical protein